MFNKPCLYSPVALISLLVLLLSSCSLTQSVSDQGFDWQKVADSQDALAVIYSMTGSVSIDRKGTTLIAEVGMPLQQGDIISTDINGFVQINFNEKGIMRQQGNSKTGIEHLQVDQNKTIVRVITGSSTFAIQHQTEQEFIVQADDQLFTVRGTIFIVEKKQDNISMGVKEGKVQVNQNPTVIELGQEINIDTKTKQSVISPLSNEKAKLLSQATKDQNSWQNLALLDISIEPKSAQITINNEQFSYAYRGFVAVTDQPITLNITAEGYQPIITQLYLAKQQTTQIKLAMVTAIDTKSAEIKKLQDERDFLKRKLAATEKQWQDERKRNEMYTQYMNPK
jgi:hypothetical protein